MQSGWIPFFICDMPTKNLAEPLLPSPPDPEVAKGPPPKSTPLLPGFGVVKLVDSVLAGIGLWFGVAMLGLMEPVVGLTLFAPPMMASGIIFSIGPSPPSPKGFISGTICSATFSFLVLACLKGVTPVGLDHGDIAQGAAAGAMLVWYKLSATVFPPAVILASSLVTASAVGSDPSRSLSATAFYLCFPWLAGHAWIYLCAYATSRLRASARAALTKNRLASLGSQSDEKLLEVFNKFDTSGDGALDADELKVALRVALGVDVSIEDCTELVNAADKDGNGTCDFDEFKAICRNEV